MKKTKTAPRWRKTALRWLLLLLGGAVLVLGGIRLTAPRLRPAAIGPVAGSLRPCPERPNCVCSQEDPDDTAHLIAPLPGNWARLVEVLDGIPGVRVVEARGHYLWAEFTSPLMGYVDDVEFLQDGGVIHVRSASRLGYSDLGANRTRVETIRSRMQ